jgi:hypothetical protein
LDVGNAAPGRRRRALQPRLVLGAFRAAHWLAVVR